MAVRNPPRPGAEASATALYCYGITAAETATPQAKGGLGGKPVEPVRFSRGGVTC